LPSGLKPGDLIEAGGSLGLKAERAPPGAKDEGLLKVT